MTLRLAIAWVLLTFAGVMVARWAEWPLWGSALLALAAMGIVVLWAWSKPRRKF